MIGRLKAPIVLAHGLFGFSRIGFGPVTLTSYFRGIPDVLRAAGNRVLTTRVHPIASIDFRGRRLGYRIDTYFPDEPVHIIGHSMGGLDARRLLAEPGWRDRILSLTTVATPHMGSILADFAKLRAGRIYRLLNALGIDYRGFLDVTRLSMHRFARKYGAIDGVPCFCVAGEPEATDVSWPLRRLYEALGEMEGPNDGLVPAASALAFGEPLPAWPLDHLRQMNWLTHAREESDAAYVPAYYGRIIANLIDLGYGADEDVEAVGAVPAARTSA
ncbi:esterase/lipase family protein [Paludisphaera rhizosphaerae]|uniref:esterase/lipase family protein n=1 Tax=Paludisphaera rhizosphaerae TaxID=2711216 RepID=UPI0013EDBFCE|nr:alpha/beta fold hydrolase [Paludisphaera rhizosphaerae]